MSFPVVRTDHLHVVGTSLTELGWHIAPNGLVDRIQSAWRPGSSLPSAAGVGARSAVNTGLAAVAQPALPSLLTVTSSGVFGNLASDIAAQVAARILAYSPTALVLEVGTNDVLLSTDPTAFGLSVDSIVTQSLAGIPALKILMPSVLCHDERWQAAGDHWGLNADDAKIALINAQLSGVAAAHASSCTYGDTRTPAGGWLSTHNTPAPGVGNLLTSEGVHWSRLGQALVGEWLLPYVAVGP